MSVTIASEIALADDDRVTRATYREVFSVRPFRTIFISRTLAIAAETLRIVALSMLVFNTTGSALLSAITFGIGFLPQVAGGALFGSLADRVRPRPLIVGGYLISSAAAVVLALAPLPIWACLALVAVVAVGAPVFGGASSRLVSEVLTGDAYVLGRAASSMSSSGAQLLGLAFGGIAVAALGPQRALLVGAALLLLAAAIVRFGLSNLAAPDQPAQGSVVRDSWSTNASLLRNGPVRRLLLIQWLPCAFVVGAEALVVAYAAMRGFSASATGYLLACAPAGMLVGDLLVGRLVSPAVRTKLVGPLICLLGAPIVFLALLPPYAVVAALLAVSGAGFAYPLGLQRSFLDALPEASRGQAFGLLSMGLMTLQGVSPVVFGTVAQLSTVGWAMALSGAATVATALLAKRVVSQRSMVRAL